MTDLLEDREVQLVREVFDMRRIRGHEPMVLHFRALPFERGLIQAVRLPSGVRRFRAEDIEALRQQMFSGFAPLTVDEDVVDVRATSVD